MITSLVKWLFYFLNVDYKTVCIHSLIHIQNFEKKKIEVIEEYKKLGYELCDIKIWFDYYDEQSYDNRNIKCITQYEQKHMKLYFKRPFKFFKVKIDS